MTQPIMSDAEPNDHDNDPDNPTKTAVVVPVYVTGLPLFWRGCNGQYSPLYDHNGQFTGRWECDRTHYWGLSLRQLILEFDDSQRRWVLSVSTGFGRGAVFKSRSGIDIKDPTWASWPQGICVSRVQPWFWQTL